MNNDSRITREHEAQTRNQFLKQIHSVSFQEEFSYIKGIEVPFHSQA